MKHIITQFSLAGALVSGYNHGDSYTVSKLTKSSSFGLGTFNDLDGELVMRDSRVFCTKKHGLTHEVTQGETKLPFVVACNHEQAKKRTYHYQ